MTEHAESQFNALAVALRSLNLPPPLHLRGLGFSFEYGADQSVNGRFLSAWMVDHTTVEIIVDTCPSQAGIDGLRCHLPTRRWTADIQGEPEGELLVA